MGLPWHNSGITPSQLSGQHIYHDLGPISAVKVHLSGIQESWGRQESLSFWARAAGSLGWETARPRALQRCPELPERREAISTSLPQASGSCGDGEVRIPGETVLLSAGTGAF